jgi:hypothetical protein
MAVWSREDQSMHLFISVAASTTTTWEFMNICIEL